jgi:peptidoglycan hydrolase-like amidase
MLTHPPETKTNKVRLLYSRVRFFPGFGALLLPFLFSGCASHGTPQPIPIPGGAPPATNRTTPPARAEESNRNQPPADAASVSVQIDGHIQRIPLDDYVRGTVAAEMWLPATEDPATAERIFEVQALVARTYAMANLRRHAAEGFDLCSSTHCQLYRELPDRSAKAAAGRWIEAIDEAVARTRGQVILFDGAPILALFHANCGGATSAAEAIWGGTARPYLRGVADVDDARGTDACARCRRAHRRSRPSR